MGHELNIKQNQKLIFSMAMRQALDVLQMPQQELCLWLKAQVEQNPALELNEELESRSESVKNKPVLPENIVKHPSLFEFLMQQARNQFRGKDLEIAEFIIGNLDEKGFFSLKHLHEYSHEKLHIILRAIQTFDPPGIAACNLKESLLIQLIRKGKAEQLCYQIVDQCFDGLVHHRISEISKKLKCTQQDIKDSIHNDLASLNLQPSANFDKQPVLAILPDIILENNDGKWMIEINKKDFPVLSISLNVLKHLTSPHLSNEEKITIRRFLASGKWLLHTLTKRQQILHQIMTVLLERQSAFFNGETLESNSCSIEEIATHLNMHPSTISRAINEKYLSCPQGLFPLKRFITQSSNHTAKELIAKLIKDEDKIRPLSDQALSELLAAQNIACSRRTIAKYRHSLNIPSANLRKL